MNKLLLVRYNLKKFFLFLIPYMLVVFVINTAFSMLEKNEGNGWIPYNIVYCEDYSYCKQYAAENRLEYYLSPSIFEETQAASDNIIMKQKLADLTYTSEATSILIERNLDYMNKENNQWIESKTRYNFYPEIINKINAPNQGLDIEYVIEGEYPGVGNEVLIPEYYAQVLLTEDVGADYSSLIGNEIELNLSNEINRTSRYSISGVYAGGYDFIFFPSLEYKNDSSIELSSIFLNFSSVKERLLFFREFDREEVIDTSDTSLVMRSYYVLYPIIKFMLAILGIYISYKILKDDIWTLNFYRWRIENIILPLILPTLIVIISIYLI